jgi:purine nucleoside phosphorylase
LVFFSFYTLGLIDDTTSVGQLAGKTLPDIQTRVVSHEEVLAIGKEKSEVMRKVVERIVEVIPTIIGT